MIKVTKNNKVPNSLLGAGVKELDKVKEEIDVVEKLSVTFSAYRQEDVKDALINAFNAKCAYCEQKFLTTGPGAVEHFRPKGRDKRKYKEPPEKYIGYYWLAAKWENLLLSCTDCNSERKHHVPGKAEKISIGKQDKFPLKNEALRCLRHTEDISQEKPVMLLINPAEEDPEPYFEFSNDGSIKAASKLNGFDLERSEKSLEVYALYREELVGARKEFYLKHIGDKILIIEDLNKVLDELHDDQKVATAIITRLINRKIQELIALGDPKEEFSSMAKQIVARELMERFDIDVNALSTANL